jgi:caffeoyl-CoA O-methyltransferase
MASKRSHPRRAGATVAHGRERSKECSRDRHVHRYAGLWLCLALQRINGRLTTFEIDHQRASMAQQHFKEAGAEKMVSIIEGDAHEQIVRLKEPVDVAFIDADKSGYVDYLHKLLPLMRPGGLILAHNVDMVPDYIKEVTTNADLETIFYTEGAGLAVTLKKR